MGKRKFQDGDEVEVVDGDFKGYHGSVLKYEDVFGRYLITIPEASKFGHFAYQEDELRRIEPDTPTEEPEENEVVDEIHIPTFGMTNEQIVSYLEYMMQRSLAHVKEIGAEDAFFGYQEWEGMSASQVLIALMFKLEEGMALFAQAHILIGRTVAAIESVQEKMNED